MSLTSFGFFAFLLVGIPVYYLSGRYGRYVLLAMSLYFYFAIAPATVSYHVKLTAIVLYILTVTYVGALLIDRAKGRWRTLLMFLSIAGLAAFLFFTKYLYQILESLSVLFHAPNRFSFLQFGSVIGVSYFILSAIGYLIDVCWQSYPAEKNPGTVCLFIFFFPQVISGPVTRFPEMKEQFCKRPVLDWGTIEHGIRRMLWGYFKKLVISDRFAVVVGTVYADYLSFSGFDLFVATLCYAIRLYTDFSGCMDIVLGAAQLFGITLPENFNAPFFSATVQEFWQRWHITLGGWFKDYVMYPFQKTKGMITLGKKCKAKFGKKAGKKIPFYLAMLLLWFLIGLWHGGAGYYFVASAAIPFTLLILGDLCSPLSERLVKLLHIRRESAAWKTVSYLRTNLLLCPVWLFVCAGSVERGFLALKHAACSFFGETNLSACALTRTDLLMMALGTVILGAAEYLQHRGTPVTPMLDRKPFAVKWLVVNAEILVILLFGLVGTSSFIYFRF